MPAGRPSKYEWRNLWTGDVIDDPNAPGTFDHPRAMDLSQIIYGDGAPIRLMVDNPENRTKQATS